MFLDYAALGILIFVVVTIFYAIIAIHDIPYEMAKHRDHPHQDAIHVGGWISLFTLHAIWPFLWIWAMLYRPGHGWGMGGSGHSAERADERIAQLESRIEQLEQSRSERRRPG
jgi:hypothetical protein